MPDEPRHRAAPPSNAAEENPTRAAQAAQIALQGAVIRAQAALLSSQADALRRAEVGGGVGLWSCRLRDEMLDWSGAAYDIFGILRGTGLQRPRILELYEPSSRRLLDFVRARAIGAGEGFRMDAEIVTACGQRRWLRTNAAIETEAGRPIRIFGTHQDVTAEVQQLAELSRRADLDALTGLANRRAFDERFRGPWAYRGRRRGSGALMLVDLDGFKQVNDVHGHAAGDSCIRVAAARLAQRCREADLVARIGGDEFAVLLPAPADPPGLLALGRDVVAVLGRPVPYGGATIRVGASVGMARAGTGRPGDLFARADAALYAAKAAGRNTVRIDGVSG